MIYDKSKDLTCPMSALPIGITGAIEALSENGRGISRRLRELGFREGCTVTCVGKSPLGGMRAYRVMGGVIALRDEDAATVSTLYGSQT